MTARFDSIMETSSSLKLKKVFNYNAKLFMHYVHFFTFRRAENPNICKLNIKIMLSMLVQTTKMLICENIIHSVVHCCDVNIT